MSEDINWEQHSVYIIEGLKRIEIKQDSLANKFDTKYDAIDTRIDKVENNLATINAKAGLLGGLAGSLPVILNLIYSYITAK